jgi:hypothetical protein
VVIAAVAVLLHVFVRQIDAVSVAVSVVITWSVALAQAFMRPVRDAECASWADLHLGGESAYETYLEHRDTGGHAPAGQRLVAWIDSGARRSVERLASMPSDVHLRKPCAVAAVALLLASVLLQVPIQTTVGVSRTKAATATAGASSDRERRDSGAARMADLASDNGSTNSLTSERGDTTSGDDGRTPAAAGAADVGSEILEARSGTNAVAAAEQAAAGGRDAGKTADTLADTGLTEAWQGELATKLHELATTDKQPSDADPMLAAEYQPAATAQDSTATPTAFEPAAAVAPEARSRVHLDPAEQAYVRSYFADSGATP